MRNLLLTFIALLTFNLSALADDDYIEKAKEAQLKAQGYFAKSAGYAAFASCVPLCSQSEDAYVSCLLDQLRDVNRSLKMTTRNLEVPTKKVKRSSPALTRLIRQEILEHLDACYESDDESNDDDDNDDD